MHTMGVLVVVDMPVEEEVISAVKLILAGPRGEGKTFIFLEIFKKSNEVSVQISAHTREMESSNRSLILPLVLVTLL